MRIDASWMMVLIAMACLSGTSLPAAAQGADDFCGSGTWAEYRPENEYREAPNLTAEPIVYSTPGDRCAAGANGAEVARLHEAVKAAAIAALSSSKWKLKVRVRFTLLPDKDAQAEMQVAGDAKAAQDMLTDFHDRIAGLKDYHSKSGLFYVQFEYAVAKARAK